MKVARKSFTLIAFVTSLALAACGGGAGSGSSVPPVNNGGSTSQSVTQQTEDSVNTANAVGTSASDLSTYNDSAGEPGSSTFAKGGAHADAVANGTCNNGVEFFAPDKNGDANSTERIDFYDNGCTQIARDAVRVYTSTGSNSENVTRTVSLYALNSTSPEAVRNEAVAFSNATFDQYGYPVASGGFDRTHTGSLTIDGSRVLDGDGELVVLPSSGNSATFCGNSAGYNATGDATLNETFGWQTLNPSGTRTVNSDGSVTWQMTRTGSAFTGAIGALSIQTGTQNSTCPISTPMFTLAGGTAKGSYSIPVSATFMHGVLVNLAVTNATLVNGDTLNITTNSNISPSDPHFISGILTNAGSTVATFNVHNVGDGTLIVTSSGKAYHMEDWRVIKSS